MCISNVILVSHRVLITPLDALPLVYIRGDSSNRTQHAACRELGMLQTPRLRYKDRVDLKNHTSICWGELHTCRANIESVDITHSLCKNKSQ